MSPFISKKAELHSFFFALLLLVWVPLSGCQGQDRDSAPDGSADAPHKDDGRHTKKTTATNTSTPKKKGSSRQAAATPVVVDVAPFTSSEHVPLDVALEYPDGRALTLKDILAYRALLVYIDTDTRDRDNRSATRMLAKVADRSKVMGFRIVVIFPENSTAADIERWIKERRMPRYVKTVIDINDDFRSRTGWQFRTAALVDDQGRIGAQWGPTTAWDQRMGIEGFTDDFLMLAFALPDPSPALDDDAKKAAIELARAAAAADWQDPSKPSRAPEAAASPTPSLPTSLTGLLARPDLRVSLKDDQRVYVRFFHPKAPSSARGTAAGGHVGEAIARAARAALDHARAFKASWRRDPALQVLIEIADTPSVVPTRDLTSLWYLIEPGIHGILLKKGALEGLIFPSEIRLDGLLTPRQIGRSTKLKTLMAEACRRGELHPRAWERLEDASLYRFRTQSFGNVGAGGSVKSLLRGNVLVSADPGAKEIRESIRLGGRWLLERVGTDGKFAYEYLPDEDKWTSGYNIVRHAGSVYGLLEMAELAQSEPLLRRDRDAYLDAVARSIGYVFDGLKPPRRAKGADRRCLLDDRGRCESGSAALSLLTLLVRPERSALPKRYRDRIYAPDDQALVEGLGLTLLDMIDADGKVFRRYDEAVRAKKVKKEPLYYPGETMLALMQLYRKTKDDKWLDAAKKIGDRQVKSYRKDRFQWPDHWVMQALYRLWQVTHNDVYADFAYQMATHSSSQQYGHLWTPWPDYRGAWRRSSDVPRTTRAGSRAEAIRAVVNLAWERGDDARIWEDSLLMAARHLSEQQYRPDNTWWMNNPSDAMGCYPMGIVDVSCRIDNNQHALVGMIGALDVARRRANPAKQ